MENNIQYILEVKNLKKYFPIKKNLLGKPLVNLKAVDNVSFNVKAGTTIGIVGESGCGKTTLGRTILKLYDIDGNEYFDFLQAGGPTVLGSNPKEVREQVIDLLNTCGPSTGLFH